MAIGSAHQVDATNHVSGLFVISLPGTTRWMFKTSRR
jgi:hypothetical protein